MTEILSLLRKLKKDKNWLLDFILGSKVIETAASVTSEMTVIELLSKCTDEIGVKMLFELKGIEKKYETDGYPKNFDSLPTPDIPDSTLALRPKFDDQTFDQLMELDITKSEARILFHLMTHGNSTASDVSRHTGIQRTEMYNYISTLLAKGVVFSTFDKPQKYYALPINETIDILIQTKQNALKKIAEKKKDYREMVETILSSTVLPESKKKESYQVVVGENSRNAKIKRMLAEANQEILIIVSDRALVDLYQAEITDEFESLNSKGIKIRLRTPCKNVQDYIPQASPNADSGETQTSAITITKISQIPIDFIIVDLSNIIIMFERSRGTGDNEMERVGFSTNSAALVFFFKYLFETLS